MQDRVALLAPECSGQQAEPIEFHRVCNGFKEQKIRGCLATSTRDACLHASPALWVGGSVAKGETAIICVAARRCGLSGACRMQEQNVFAAKALGIYLHIGREDVAP